MGRLALTVAGTVAGNLILPGLGGQIGALVGGIAGDHLFSPTLRNVGPRIDDTSVRIDTYGSPIVRSWGNWRLTGVPVWSSDYIEHRNSEDVGGKGGPSGSNVSFSYTISFAVMFGNGPKAGIRRIWINKELYYDAAAEYGSDLEALEASLASQQGIDGVTVYLGTEGQTADPLIAADPQYASGAPAYRGRVVLVFEDWDAGGGQPIPVVEAEFFSEVASNAGDPIPTRQLAAQTRAYEPSHLSGSDIYSWRAIRHVNGGDLATVFQYKRRYGEDDVEIFASNTIIAGLGGQPDPTDIETYPGNSDTPNIAVFRFYDDAWVHYTFQSSNQALLTSLPLIGTNKALRWVYRDRTLALLHEGTRRIFVYRSAVPLGLPIAIERTVTGTAFIEDVGMRADGALVYYLTEAGQDIIVWTFSPDDLIAPVEFFRITAVGAVVESRIHVNETDIWISSAGTIWQYSIGGALKDVFASAAPGDNLLTTGRSVVTFDGTDEQWQLANPSLGKAVSIGTIVQGVCTEADVAADTSLIDAIEIDGYAIPNVMPSRAALEPLQQIANFDLVDDNSGLRAVPRGSASVIALSDDDIIDTDPPRINRESELTLPKNVVVNYIDKDADYLPGSQQAQRIAVMSRSVETFDMPVSMSAQEAAELSDTYLYRLWQTRDSIDGLVLMPKHARLEPSDVVSLTTQGTTRNVRLTSTALSSGVNECQATVEDSEAYTSAAVAGSLGVRNSIVPYAGSTTMRLLDIPLLRRDDNDSGLYVGAVGKARWPGAQIFRSLNQQDWTAWATVRSPMTWGRATTELPSVTDTTVIDFVNSVDVVVYDGELSSTNQPGLEAGVNAAILGEEVIGFQNATFLGSKTWRLNVLLRGQRGTVTTHTDFDRFVLLNQTLEDGAIPISQRGEKHYFRAVAFGTSLNSAVTDEVTYDYRRGKPYAPINIVAAVGVAPGTYDVTWDEGGAPLLVIPGDTYRVVVTRGAATIDDRTGTATSQVVTAIAGDTITVTQISPSYGSGDSASVVAA